METQNITLSLPKRLLRRVKLLAVQRNTSVSALLAEALQQMVDESSGYSAARKRQQALMQSGMSLGLGSTKPASREELHER